jgi:cytoskeletal protein CcmA (bactofilin family)
MGFIGKGSKTKHSNSHTTVISQGVEINGELILDAKLHVDGKIKGEIRSRTDVSIGITGEVEGTVVARNMVICGLLTGKVDCDCVEIMPTGRLFGEVVSKSFVVEPGGRFSGDNRRRADDEPLALEHLGTELSGAGAQLSSTRRKPG